MRADLEIIQRNSAIDTPPYDYRMGSAIAALKGDEESLRRYLPLALENRTLSPNHLLTFPVFEDYYEEEWFRTIADLDHEDDENDAE